MRAPRLRTYLAALVLAVLLPSLALGAATAWYMAQNYRRASEDRLLGTARALALALDRELQSHTAALVALAASPHLDNDDLAGFYAHARGAAEAIATPVVLIGADLRQRLHTARPFGSPLPVTNAPEAVKVALASRQPFISDLLTGAVLQQPVVTVVVPIMRHGRAEAVLTAPVSPHRLSALLAAQGFADGAFATLTDSRRVVVARSENATAFLGRPVPVWFGTVTNEREAGILQGRALVGHDVILAFQRLSVASGWTVVVAEPLNTYNASWRRPLVALAVGGTATFVAALIAAAWLGKRILRPVRTLAQQAEAVTRNGGKASELDRTSAKVAEFDALRLAMRKADEVLWERETRLQAVVETATDAIIVIDERGIVQSANYAAVVIFGYTSDEMVGRNISLLMPAETATEHDSHLAAYRRTGKRTIIGKGREVVGQKKDGSKVPLDLSIAEWRDARGERFFTGIMRDISLRKEVEARQTVLLREVDHRTKNALAVVQSILRMTPRDQPGAFDAAESRIAGLARAHSLLAEEGWSGADLRLVAERELSPFARALDSPESPAVFIDGPRVTLAPAAVQPVAMVLHELATNAAKHGALSVPGGKVELRWSAGRRESEDGLLRMHWTETGGPPIDGPPRRRGFGTRLVEATVRSQLGGSVARRWEPSGLVVEVALPPARVLADSGHASKVAVGMVAHPNAA